jgi:hypothetical protein
MRICTSHLWMILRRHDQFWIQDDHLRLKTIQKWSWQMSTSLYAIPHLMSYLVDSMTSWTEYLVLSRHISWFLSRKTIFPGNYRFRWPEYNKAEIQDILFLQFGRMTFHNPFCRWSGLESHTPSRLFSARSWLFQSVSISVRISIHWTMIRFVSKHTANVISNHSACPLMISILPSSQAISDSDKRIVLAMPVGISYVFSLESPFSSESFFHPSKQRKTSNRSQSRKDPCSVRKPQVGFPEWYPQSRTLADWRRLSALISQAW